MIDLRRSVPQSTSLSVIGSSGHRSRGPAAADHGPEPLVVIGPPAEPVVRRSDRPGRPVGARKTRRSPPGSRARGLLGGPGRTRDWPRPARGRASSAAGFATRPPQDRSSAGRPAPLADHGIDLVAAGRTRHVSRFGELPENFLRKTRRMAQIVRHSPANFSRSASTGSIDAAIDVRSSRISMLSETQRAIGLRRPRFPPGRPAIVREVPCRMARFGGIMELSVLSERGCS